MHPSVSFCCGSKNTGAGDEWHQSYNKSANSTQFISRSSQQADPPVYPTTGISVSSAPQSVEWSETPQTSNPYALIAIPLTPSTRQVCEFHWT
ncbi:hypothetical protein BD410DRAFT_785336 [Rickenella mellea]|uniref:Uncharacterized protein n=1 Tax=Rickenella mellea TaxID=50990 RepID=A0A4Y7QDS6_9AGAM|nr:hypothetical protein BD410DRAFT_785336 [Rickenella mellea]